MWIQKLKSRCAKCDFFRFSILCTMKGILKKEDFSLKTVFNYFEFQENRKRRENLFNIKFKVKISYYLDYYF